MVKLTLKQASEEDAKFAFEMMDDKEYKKHLPERLLFHSIEDAKQELRHFRREAKRGNKFYFILMNGKQKVGILDLYKISKQDKKAALGYGILREQWGKGYGTLACKIGVYYAKNKLKLHSLEATADPKNLASQRILEKNGFEKVGVAKDYYFDRGKYIDRALYGKILD